MLTETNGLHALLTQLVTRATSIGQDTVRAREPKHLVVVSDLEPDDFFALLLLMHSGALSKFAVTIVVSGWQSPLDKARFLDALLSSKARHLKNNCASLEILVGEAIPDKTFDLPSIPGCVPNASAKFGSYRDLEPGWWSHKLVLCLAPPRELLFEFRRDPYAFAHSSLAIYGSYNLRSLPQRGEASPEELSRMIASFCCPLLYETFLVTGAGTNSIADSRLLALLSREQFDWFARIVESWNQQISAACIRDIDAATITRSADDEEIRRDRAVVESIKAEPRQFAHADGALASTLLLEPPPATKLARLSFGSAPDFYTRLSDPDEVGENNNTAAPRQNLVLAISTQVPRALYGQQLALARAVLE